MAPARPASLKVRALQWLAQREHSRSELHDKLLRLLQRSQPADLEHHSGGDGDSGGGQDDALAGAQAVGAGSDDTGVAPAAEGADGAQTAQAEVEAVLAWLEQHGHLSDTRFAESRVHARAPRYGNRRIQQELRQHGVVLDADAQQALRSSEFSRACAVWQRKYGAPAADAAGRLRQMRFLAGRGFSMDVVQQVLKHGAAAAADEAAGSGAR